MKCYLSIIFVLLTQTAFAGPLCHALMYGSVQDELKVDKSEEWFAIVKQYEGEAFRPDGAAQNHDAELLKKIPADKAVRLRQLAFQTV